MTTITTYRMNSEQRTHLRRMVTDNALWPAYSEAMGKNASTLTVKELWGLATVFGIDGHAAIESVGPLTGLSKTVDMPETIVTAQSVIRGRVRADDLEAELAKAAAETPVTPVKVDADKADKLEALEALLKLLAGRPSVDADAVQEIVDAATADLKSRLAIVEAQKAPKPDVHVVRDGQEIGRLEGLRHKQTDDLLKLASAALAYGGNGALNIWITGPAGSGKTFAVEQVSKALGIDFVFHGSMSMSHELLGFVDAGGRYHETFFVDAYRNGKAVLLDEVDAGSNEALLTLNASLAGSKLALPNGEIIDRHPNFIAFGAANTFGGGATAEYVGRARIDAAFLDRFALRIDWQYDEALEKAIAGSDAWTEQVQKARAKARDAGLKTLITPRATEAGAALIAAGMSADDAAKFTYLANLTPEQRAMVS